MRKTLLPAVLLALASLSSALASPAQDLFDQASFYLEFYYYGPSQVDIKALTPKYQAQLDTACASQKDTCPYSAARPLIEAMAEELSDNHTYYLPPEDRQARTAAQSGQAAPALRIGVATREIEGSTERVVISVRGDGPAFEAGMRRGDRIATVDGQPLPAGNEASSQFISERVRTGRAVAFGVKRGERALQFSVTGKQLSAAELPYLEQLPNNVAVLHIPSFDTVGRVGSRVHQLVKQAQDSGARAMIVDLRDDPGGVDVEAVSAIAAFVPNVYVRSEQKRGAGGVVGFRDGTVYRRSGENPESVSYRLQTVARWQGPLAVLVNENSASGSEYFASVIQFAKLGPVIGVKTGGVGNTASLPARLIDGSGLNVTYSRAFYMDGRPFPEFVTPDIEAKDDLDELARSGRDLPMEKAYEALGIR